MALQIIYGVKKSGKSEYMLRAAENAWRTTKKNVFFIVPEQYSYETEKALVERLGVISPRTVEVLSFKRLFFYVCNNLGGGLLPRLTDTGKNILLSKAAAKCSASLHVLGKTAKYGGFADIMAQLFSELKRYNTTPEGLSKITKQLEENTFLRLKMEDISLLYKTYEEEIAGAFTDPDDELTLLCKILEEHKSFFADSIFFIDEFEGFTPQEITVIGELAKQADEVKITLCCDALLKKGNQRSLFEMQIKTAAALTDMAERLNIPAKKPVYLENGYKFCNIPELIHLEKNLRYGTFEKYEGKAEAVRLMFSLNYNGELEQIAEEIIRLTRDEGYRFRDFTVVARDREAYEKVAAAVFARYKIPIYVNGKTPLSEETPAYALISAVNVFLKKWDYNSVFTYLKTGYSNLSDGEIDFIENYIIKTGIRGTGWTNGKPWKYTPEGYNEEALEKLEKIREKITEPISHLEESFEKAVCVRDYIKALVEFMQSCGFEEKIICHANKYRLQLPDTAKRYEQIYGMMIKAFDDIDAVCDKEEKITSEEFARMLQAAFEAHSVGIIPTSADSVTFTDAERCRAGKCRIMFVAGVCDGVFPSVFTGEGIIKDAERKTLESLGLKMAPDTVSRTFDEDFIVYTTLTHPEERLYLSYPMSDNAGGTLSPSMLIRQVKNLFPEIVEQENVTTEKTAVEKITMPGVTLDRYAVEKSLERDGESIDPLWQEAEKWFKNHEEFAQRFEMIKKGFEYTNSTKSISKENLKTIYKDQVYTSVSRLETYKKCPFMYYAKYILGATVRETTELRSVDTGNIMHGVMEKLSLRVKEELGSWNKADDSWILATAEEIAEQELEEIRSSLDIVEPRQMWAFLRVKEAVKTSACVVAKQLQSGEFIPMGYEITFGDNGEFDCIEFEAGGKTIKLTGKVDRGDMYTAPDGKKYIRIIDYKSGNKDINIEDIYYGLSLQLAVYLDSLTTQTGAMCAGMLYCRLYDPIVKTENDIDEKTAEEKRFENRKSTGLLISDWEILKKMDKALENDEKTYLPVGIKKDGSFTVASKVATYGQFEAMNKYLRKTIKEMSRSMLEGKTSVYPIKQGDKTPCTYCDYSAVCHFETAHGNRYKYLKKIKSDEAWAEIMKEVGEDA